MKIIDKPFKLLMIGAVLSTLSIAGGDISATEKDYIDVEYNDSSRVEDVYKQYKEKLMWQDEIYKDHEEGAYKNRRSSGKAGSWNHAIDYCDNLNYAGYTDWRLPTVNELEGLHAYVRELKHSLAADFWTSTPDKVGFYWSVYTADGYSYKHKKRDSHYIRCVRTIDDKKASNHPASSRL